MSEEIDPVTGLPKIGDEAEAKKAGRKSLITQVITHIVLLTIGFVIGALIFYLGDNEAYKKKLAAGKEADLGWAALAIFILGLTIFWLNLFPTYYKGMIAPAGISSFRSNQFIYKQAVGGADGE